MVEAEYVEGDRFAGVSLGIQYNYRYTRNKGQLVIYDIRNGEIVERIEDTGNDQLTEDTAMKRLYEINGIKNTITEEMKDLLDIEN